MRCLEVHYNEHSAETIKQLEDALHQESAKIVSGTLRPSADKLAATGILIVEVSDDAAASRLLNASANTFLLNRPLFKEVQCP